VVTLGLLRAWAITAVIVTLYFVVPLDGLADVPAAVTLPLALLAFVALLAVQVRAILRSAHPGLRAVEALAICLPLFLVIFAAAYYVASVAQPSWFTESLSRLDAMYFTVTVFSTVGFGDISATAPATRTAVMVQMVADLAILGVGLKILTGAVREARSRDVPSATPADAPRSPDPGEA
jgi:hypothetical protein